MIAIGVMARAPIPGLSKTRLLAAHESGWVASLHAAMLRDSLDGLQAVAADRFVVFGAPVPESPSSSAASVMPEDREARTRASLDVLARHVPSPWELTAQEGDDLASCIENAFAALFDRGASYVVLAGTDAPSFPTEPLVRALEDAPTREGVLAGPTEDGSYYLLGMPRLEPRLLRDMPWGSPAMMETTRLRCRDLGLGLTELPRWYDVDEPSDVLTLLDELRKHPERAPRTAQFFVRNA